MAQHRLLAAGSLVRENLEAVLAGHSGAGAHPAHDMAGDSGGAGRAGGTVNSSPAVFWEQWQLPYFPADRRAGRSPGGGDSVAGHPAPAGAGHGRGSGCRRPGGPVGHREDVLRCEAPRRGPQRHRRGNEQGGGAAAEKRAAEN